MTDTPTRRGLRTIKVVPVEGQPEDHGSAPILQWVAIDDLVVDETYQRDLKPGNWKVIRKIADNFRWSMFSPVFVAPVEGGKFAIIDGQHRTHAAAAIGIEQVPCQVVPMDQREQAAAFAAVNGTVTKVTTWQIFKAAFAAGEKWAISCDEIARAAGCRVMMANKSHYDKKPGEIYGIRTFREIVERYDRVHIVQALSVLMATEGIRDAPEMWDSQYLRALLSAFCQRPRAMACDDFVGKLELLDVWTMGEEIVAENRERIRKGLPYLAKKDALEARILDWIDTTFPERIALPMAGE